MVNAMLNASSPCVKHGIIDRAAAQQSLRQTEPNEWIGQKVSDLGNALLHDRHFEAPVARPAGSAILLAFRLGRFVEAG